MTGAEFLKQAGALRRDDSGATLVEFGVVLAIFLLIFFGLIDFGRMAFHYVTAEKAMQVAARVAAVRPSACPGLPDTYTRGYVAPGTVPPKFGTSCNAAANVCSSIGTLSCAGSASNPTATEIWAIVRGTMPRDATIANLRFIYSADTNLGFLGGPLVPVVTVELQNQTFRFVTPLAQLVSLAGGDSSQTPGGTIAFPNLSASLPGEDLALGNGG